MTDYKQSVEKEIWGIKILVIPRDEVIAYKKILSRPEDLSDIEELMR